MYTKVDALIWSDDKYRSLSVDGKLLFIYVLTCNHRNMLGLYHLPVPYGAYDLDWDIKRFDKGLHELLDKGLVNYNFNTNIILIPNFLKYNPLENQNQVKGALKAISTIPTNGLDVDLISTLKAFNKPFVKPLIELLNKRLGKQEEVKEEVEVEVKEEVEVDIPEEEPLSKYQVIIDTWNELQLAQIKSINSNRLKMVQARVKEFSIDEILQAIESIKNSSFLKGQNKNNWIITFDWFIKPNNFIKVLEGNYLDKGGRNGINGNSNQQDKAENGGWGDLSHLYGK